MNTCASTRKAIRLYFGDETKPASCIGNSTKRIILWALRQRWDAVVTTCEGEERLTWEWRIVATKGKGGKEIEVRVKESVYSRERGKENLLRRYQKVET